MRLVLMYMRATHTHSAPSLATSTHAHTYTQPWECQPPSGSPRPTPAPSHASWECDSRGLPQAPRRKSWVYTHSGGPRRQPMDRWEKCVLWGGRFWLKIKRNLLAIQSIQQWSRLPPGGAEFPVCGGVWAEAGWLLLRDAQKGALESYGRRTSNFSVPSSHTLCFVKGLISFLKPQAGLAGCTQFPPPLPAPSFQPRWPRRDKEALGHVHVQPRLSSGQKDSTVI